MKASRDPGRLQELSLERIQLMNSKVARFENLGRSQKFNLERIQNLNLGKFQECYSHLLNKYLLKMSSIIYLNVIISMEKKKTCILINNRNCTSPVTLNTVFLFIRIVVEL